ncbi:MAG TPA: UDP-N-acetylglucosamine--LPS N-acetylglucosamine transferase [Clostridiaceae bacterium]|nr:UDP-N-acetylglucosamine--LPS N-acetylglucosamine transferase [Clostridiaceae bacterium]
MRILYLTVSVGGGHLKAAEAIKGCFETKYPGSQHMIIDALKYVNPVLDKIVVGSYLSTIKTTPQLYRILYKRSETGDNIYDFSSKVSQLLSFKMMDLIEDFKPDAIICTHPFSLQFMSRFKTKKGMTIPIIATLTDFNVHSFWLYDFIDAYVVAHEYMKYDMVKRGIPEGKIFPYGIPVSDKFLEKKERSKLIEEFNLEDRKYTALVMGGSLGFGKMIDSIRSLAESDLDHQIIVITGKNNRKENELKQLASEMGKPIKIISYTDRVADYMEVSDFIITKPGGMTLAESLVKVLPIFIVSPIPGHEEDNAQFLLNMGCAVRIWKYTDMDIIIKETIENPLRLNQMKEMAKFLARPYAAENTVTLVENLI